MPLAAALAGERLETADGRESGVKRRTRHIVRAGPGSRELWLGHTKHGLGPDGRPLVGQPLVGRRVVGWLDLGAYPLPRDAYVPEGAQARPPRKRGPGPRPAR